MINSGESPTTMSRAAVRKYKIPAAAATATAPIHDFRSLSPKFDIELTTNEHNGQTVGFWIRVYLCRFVVKCVSVTIESLERNECRRWPGFLSAARRPARCPNSKW